jgi:hypothetical protein
MPDVQLIVSKSFSLSLVRKQRSDLIHCCADNDCIKPYERFLATPGMTS